ncbi:MAG: pyruvate kinase [Oscillospiraceae bacterium]|nr:pyruvate kinase [Oscillospiraceae bacterium]
MNKGCVMRKTKVICTLGPAVSNEEAIRNLILGGMDAARFNFSHGTHAEHLERFQMFRHIRDELGLPIAAILDTKGPEVRIKTFAAGKVELKEGAAFTLTTDEVAGDETRVSVTYQNLPRELLPGCRILLDDGLLELAVTEITGQDILCTVKTGGVLSNNKSINIPEVNILLPSLTDRDKEDLAFGVAHEFDFVAASFVRSKKDIEAIRDELKRLGGDRIQIIAKIENREGVRNLDEIIEAADGIMVARGDLGVEIPMQEVPALQKQMIQKSVIQGKLVITATQMLDSMIRNPRPTRAEVSDVANAVFDGTSCVMLSGETASGKYPQESLRQMVDIVLAAESAIDYWKQFRETAFSLDGSITNAMSHTGCLAAMDLNATAITVATNTGRTARMVARFQPACPIAAITMTEQVRRQLNLTWGVSPYLSGQVDSTDRIFSLCRECAQKEGLVQAGDVMVIVAGVPIGQTGATNLIKVQVV